jgi:hypothetical protein
MIWPTGPERSTNDHTVLWSSAESSRSPCAITEFYHNSIFRILFGSAYLGTTSSTSESDCTRGNRILSIRWKCTSGNICVIIRVYG